jgi:hypothetical protein
MAPLLPAQHTSELPLGAFLPSAALPEVRLCSWLVPHTLAAHHLTPPTHPPSPLLCHHANYSTASDPDKNVTLGVLLLCNTRSMKLCQKKKPGGVITSQCCLAPDALGAITGAPQAVEGVVVSAPGSPGSIVFSVGAPHAQGAVVDTQGTPKERSLVPRERWSAPRERPSGPQVPNHQESEPEKPKVQSL